MKVILDKDGYAAVPTGEVEIYELAEIMGGTVIDIADYVPPMPTIDELRAIESAWQETELKFIENQLLAIEEEAQDALPGTRKDWLQYRTKVRLWHESPDFPGQEKRPVRPT